MQIPGYRIIRKINSGGMASVYLAIQISVGRTVALKIMKPELDQDPEFHQRFKCEAEIVGQLSHPNVIPIYDIGRHQGLNFISMEYLPGGSLDEKILSGLSTNEVIDIMLAIANALEHAHSRGYVHRDIKPENILFRADKTAVLTDFGIAKTLKNNLKMTQAGKVIGTPYYMSPEQAKGLDADGRSDLYSLGILCYEMLTGSRPFRSETSLALAIQHINEQPPKLPIHYFTFQAILDRLLAKQPEQRFQTARDLIHALATLKNTANVPLLQPSGSANSIQLLKVIGRTLAQDLRLAAQRTAPFYHRLLAYLKQQPRSGAHLVQRANTPDIHTAETSVYAVSPRLEKSLAMPSFIKIALGLALLLTAIWVVVLQVNKHPSEQRKSLSLTIIAQPAHAKIRILNIVEKYTPGMALATGEYHLNIKAPGYETADTWIKLTPSNQTLEFALRKIAEKNQSAEETIIIPQLLAVPDSHFLIGKYEVTFNEYDNFAVATNRSLPDDNGWGRGDHPVINVSWDDAQAYVNWLSKTTGSRYRLPSSAEWELAARGKTSSVFWWGDNPADARTRANCRFGCRSLWSNLFDSKTALVGSYPPNAFGLHDTAGNIAEWVDDCYTEQNTEIYAANNGDQASHYQAQDCTQKIIRGGSFRDKVTALSSAAIAQLAANTHSDSTGFRVLKEMNPERDKRKTEGDSNQANNPNFFKRLINKLRQ